MLRTCGEPWSNSKKYPHLENWWVGLPDVLIGDDICDPFTDSTAAVDAFNNGDWLLLLEHNFAEIQRTRELAELAGRFVPKSDLSMKNLKPPHR